MKKIFLFLIIVFIGFIGFVGYFRPDFIAVFFQDNEKSRELYKAALDYQQKEDYKAAYYSLSQISPKYKIYDIVLFQQANFAAKLQDEQTVVRKLQTLLTIYPDSPVAPQASYLMGQALVRQGNFESAEKQFVKTLKKYPGTDYALGSFYYLGEINKEKNTEISSQYWIKYMAMAPNGRFAMECLRGIEALPYQLSQRDKKFAAIVLYFAKKYHESLKYLNQLALEDNWYYIAKSYEGLGYKNKALEVYKQGLKKYLDREPSTSKIQQAMLSYVTLSNKNNYNDWDDLADWVTECRDFALFHKAQLISIKKGKRIYQEIYEKYPQGNFASNALWNLFWIETDRKNYDKAIELGEKHVSNYFNTKDAPAVYFWLGKIFESKGEGKKAKFYYKSVMSKYPDSYYSFRADGRLAAMDSGVDKGWATNIESTLPLVTEFSQVYSYAELAKKYGVKAAELFDLGDYDLAMSFIDADQFLQSWVKRKKGMVTSSIVTARKAIAEMDFKPEQSDFCWQLAFPVYYTEQINNFAKNNKLDPSIVISLMREESHFNPFAVSSSDARGLMQLLPTTASDIARWKNLGRYSSQELFKPEVNIKLGTAYLKYVKDVLKDEMMLAVAAYNGGPAAVSRWLKSSNSDDFDKFIENIPYSQTRNYVKKVYASYWNYKRIYQLN